MFKLQDPGETLDYTIDWTDWMSSADTLSTSSWKIDPDPSGSPSVLTNSSIDTSADTATIFVSGLSRNTVYHLTNTVTTTQGRTGERSITIRCDEA